MGPKGHPTFVEQGLTYLNGPLTLAHITLGWVWLGVCTCYLDLSNIAFFFLEKCECLPCIYYELLRFLL